MRSGSSLGRPQLGMLPPPSSIESVGHLGSSLDPVPPPSSAVYTSPAAPAGGSAQQGLSISIALRPVPARIVGQIQRGQFVDMRDLLADNVALRSHSDEVRDSLGANVVSLATGPRVRELSSIPSWICCYLTFLAVCTTDAVTRERLAYAILLVREAMRHGGTGWVLYGPAVPAPGCP